MRISKLFFFLILFFYFFLQNYFAEVCVAPDLKVSTLSGVVIFRNGTVLKDLKIHLSKDSKGEKLIKEVTTDQNGVFSFGDIKPNKYYIIIEKYEYLKSIVFMVKVKKKYGRKQPVGIRITMVPTVPGDCSAAESYPLETGG